MNITYLAFASASELLITSEHFEIAHDNPGGLAFFPGCLKMVTLCHDLNLLKLHGRSQLPLEG